MPKRTKNHELEDTSRFKFQSVIPNNWVFRNKEKDYGIDGEVEIFDEVGNATGLIFFVQLKATSSRKKSTIMNVDLKIETIKYYKKLDVPVLLVRYSEFEDKFYLKWVYNLDLFFLKKRQKKLRIKFKSEDRWNSKSNELVLKRLRQIRNIKQGRFSYPFNVSVNIIDDSVNSKSREVLLIELKRKLKKYSDYLRVSKPSDTLLNIELSNDKLSINLIDLSACTFHRIFDRKKDQFSEDIAKDILLGIGIILFNLGHVERLAEIIFKNNLEDSLILREEILEHCLPQLIQSSYVNDVLKLIDNIYENIESTKLRAAIDLTTLFSRGSKNESTKEAVEYFLNGRLNKAIEKKDDSLIGIAHYNLGNFYKGVNENRKAIYHYIRAKRFEPIYLKQDYFFTELGGLFFEQTYFKFSAKLYRVAVELGADIKVKALLGDALLYSGEYSQSINTFEDYLRTLNDNEHPILEFQLKYLCISEIVEEEGIEKQIRKTVQSSKVADISKIDDPNEIEKRLKSALELDLLSPLAWYNIGVKKEKEKEYEEGFFAFLMCALINRFDLDAWVNATLCSLNCKDTPYYLGYTVLGGISLNGEDYLELLYKEVEKQQPEFLSTLSNAIDKIINLKDKTENNLPVMRILNEEGKFVNIFDMLK